MFVIGFSDKPMILAKKWLFSCLNTEYGGNFKVGCPSIERSLKGRRLLTYNAIWGFRDPVRTIRWIAETFLLFATFAVKRRRMLHLTQSYESIGNFRLPLSKLLEAILHVEKGVWGTIIIIKYLLSM